MAQTEDLATNYAGRFDGHLGFGKSPALLIIDFVQVCVYNRERLVFIVTMRGGSALRRGEMVITVLDSCCSRHTSRRTLPSMLE